MSSQLLSEGAALLQWVNKFQTDRKAESLNDLCDGVVLYKLLSFVEPSHFKISDISLPESGSSMVAVTNLSTLLDKLAKFFEANNRPVDLSSLSPVTLGQGKDVPGLIKLLEFILVAAVSYSEKKDTAVSHIESVSEAEQKQLMDVARKIVHYSDDDLDELEDPADEPTPEKDNVMKDLSLMRNIEKADRIAELEMINKKLEQDKRQLQDRIDQIQRDFKETKTQYAQLRVKHEQTLEAKETEIKLAVEQALAKAAQGHGRRQQIQTQRLAESDQKHEELEVELAQTKSALESLKRKTTTELSELKAQNRKLQDELDVAASKLKQASLVEQSAARYKKKLSEMGDVRVQLSEAIEQHKRSVERCVELEQELNEAKDEVRQLQGTNRLLNTKNQELMHAEAELTKEITTLKEVKEKLKEELNQTKQEKKILEAGGASLMVQDASTPSRVFGAPIISPEMTGSLAQDLFYDGSQHEKLIRLEKENKTLKEKLDLQKGDVLAAQSIRDKLSQLERENKGLKEKLDAQRAVADKSMMDLSSSVPADKGTEERDQKIIDKLKEEKDNLEKQNRIQQEQYERLKEEIEKLRSAADAKSSTDTKKKITGTRNYEQRMINTVGAFSQDNHQLQDRIAKMEQDKRQLQEDQRLIASAFYEIGFEYHRSLHTSHNKKSWFKQRQQGY